MRRRVLTSTIGKNDASLWHMASRHFTAFPISPLFSWYSASPHSPSATASIQTRFCFCFCANNPLLFSLQFQRDNSTTKNSTTAFAFLLATLLSLVVESKVSHGKEKEAKIEENKTNRSFLRYFALTGPSWATGSFFAFYDGN